MDYNELRSTLISLKEQSPTNLTNMVNRRKELLERLTFFTNFLPNDAKTNRRCWHVIENNIDPGKCPSCGGVSNKWGKIGVVIKNQHKGTTYGYKPCSKECSKAYRALRAKQSQYGDGYELPEEQKDVSYTKKELTDILKQVYGTKKVGITVRNMKLDTFIKKYTSFLPDDSTNSRRIHHLVHGIKDIPKCEYCGENDADFGRNYNGVGHAYKPCNDCKDEWMRDKISKGIKDNDAIKKQRATMVEKYGVEHNWNHGPLREKLEQANLEKYGERWYVLTDNFKNEYKRASLERWGTEHPMQSAGFQKLYKEMQDSGMHPFNDPYLRTKSKTEASRIWNNRFIDSNLPYEVVSFKNKLEVSFLHKKCGEIFTTSSGFARDRVIKHGIELCTHCNPIGEMRSQAEKDVAAWVESIYNGEVVTNTRSPINPYEIDIYLPELKLGIEYNGSYWHSTRIKHRNYHQEKYNHALSKGIRLIQIWETDWIYRQDIVKSIISNAILQNCTRIYARKTDLRVLQFKDVKDFLDKNHIQGHLVGSVYLGLFYEDELRSVMTFNLRNKSESLWEIGRLATSIGFSVVGGASKMFKYFLRNYDPKEIYTYAFLDFFTGSVYDKLGMQFSHNTVPGYFYVDVFGFRYNRRQFSKKNLVKKGVISKTDTRSETTIMDELGFMKTYNCGNAKYVWHSS